MSVRISGLIASIAEPALQPARIEVGDNGLIEAIYGGQFDSTANYHADNKLIVPGFVDVHVHGAGGADFMDASVDAVRHIARTHAQHGTTTLLATTLTATAEQIDACIDAVAEVMRNPGPDEARIAGIHLEGPYISAAKRGAQPLEPIRPPDIVELHRWIERSGNTIRQITMAPEVAGATEFIQAAVDAGVVVSIGHTSATYEQALEGVAAGASHATHLFNAMPPLNHREPGALGAILTSPGVHVEIIADGIHVHPAVVNIALLAKHDDRVVLITDAMSGATMPDGVYHLGGSPVNVSNGTAKYADGTLAGSVLTMDRAFINIQRFAGASAAAASRMASLNASRQIGMDNETGTIEVGKRADLAVIDPETGEVEATMLNGKWIWRR